MRSDKGYKRNLEFKVDSIVNRQHQSKNSFGTTDLVNLLRNGGSEKHHRMLETEESDHLDLLLPVGSLNKTVIDNANPSTGNDVKRGTDQTYLAEF